MSAILGHLADTWKRIWMMLAPAQKVSVILIGLLTLVAMGVVLYLNSQPDWMIVYSDLETKQGARIYELAVDQGIPVEMKNGGRTLLVPSQHVDTVRMLVERAEIVTDGGGVGWELFDEVKLGATDQQQQVGYQRALQGELARMISELPGIARAQVMVAFPPRRVVVARDQRQASAAVMVTLKQRTALDASQIKSIRMLVSSSVVGLEPGMVTISDNRGRLLAGREATGAGVAAGNQLEVQAVLEDQLRNKVESVLGPIVGFGNVVASVTVDLDMDHVRKSEERYHSEGAVIVSERVVSEESESSEGSRGAAAGTSSNLVSVSDPSGQSSPSDSTQETRKTVENQYLVPKTTEHVERQGVRIKRLSVAVTVAALGEENPRTAEQLEALRQLVASSVGASEDGSSGRQDLIRIAEGDFSAVDAPPEPLPTALLDTYRPYLELLPSLRPVAGVGLVIVLLIAFRRIFSRTDGDEFQVGSEPLNAQQILEANDEQEHQASLSPHKSAQDDLPLNLIRQQATSSPEEVGSAVEALLRGDPD